jgi:hypothetical protein
MFYKEGDRSAGGEGDRSETVRHRKRKKNFKSVQTFGQKDMKMKNPNFSSFSIF